MRRTTRLIALTVIFTGGMGLALRAQAQAPTPAPSSNQVSPPATNQVPPAPIAETPREPVPPARYLDEARRELDQLPSSPHRDSVRRELAHVRAVFDDMVSAYRSAASAPEGPGDRPARAEWQSSFSSLERDLAELIGGSSALVLKTTEIAVAPASQPSSTASHLGIQSATGKNGSVGVVTRATAEISPTDSAHVSPAAELTAPANPTGTSGTLRSTTSKEAAASTTPLPPEKSDVSRLSDTKDFDPALREALERFRLDIELFFDATVIQR
jgi:hypothetical protein